MNDAAHTGFSLPPVAIAVIVGILICLVSLAAYAWWLDALDRRDIQRNGVDE